MLDLTLILSIYDSSKFEFPHAISFQFILSFNVMNIVLAFVYLQLVDFVVCSLTMLLKIFFDPKFFIIEFQFVLCYFCLIFPIQASKLLWNFNPHSFNFGGPNLGLTLLMVLRIF